MDYKLLLSKCVILLYRESQLKNKIDLSNDLVKTVISTIQVKDMPVGLSNTKEIVTNLKQTVMEMCDAPIDQEYSIDDLLQTISYITKDDNKLYDSIKDSIESDISESQIRRIIVNIKKSINNHFKEQQINDILNRASYTFKYTREKIKDVNDFISDLISQLEPLQISNSLKDPAVISDIDIGDDKQLKEMFTAVREINKGNKIYKTGWQALNKMLQGGIRQGETVLVSGLQHKYKTGMNLSLFAQIALHNKPLTADKNKKPLLLRISFEDSILTNLQFLYQKLKFDETGEEVDVKDADVTEMSVYVKTKLQVNGFHVKMLRVDPSQWTYKNICNKIIELEAEGYNIELLFLDYLAMVPTIGCTSTGPMGTDMRDLFRRMRNFTSARNIAMVTPHQLSTEAKNLLRSGLPEEQFVKEINEKGYYSGSKQLDQEVDTEVYIHLFKWNKITYLAVQRGKHRIPTIIPEDDKYFILKFPKTMPIPDDINGEDTSIKKLFSSATNASDDLFKLG